MKYWFFILFSLSLNTCFAQQSEEIVAAKKLTEFYFTMLTGGTIILKAQLDNGADSLNFILDTGSGGISLDSATVELYGLQRTKTNRTIKGIAGLKVVDFVYNHSLKMPGLRIDNLDFHINNYDILTSAYGIKINGVIGYSFLRRYIVKIDYDIHKIEVFSIGKIKYPKKGYVLYPSFNGLPVVDNGIEDNIQTKGSFIFDTGAGLNMLLSEDYVRDSSILKKKRRKFITQAEGLGGKKLMHLSVVKKIKLGPYTFRWVPIYIFRDDYNVINYPKMNGLIGNDILRRFNTIFNYANGEIHLQPNNHFFEDFDYSYTGLGLYQVNGEIVVEDVVENSPGYKSGFKPNDKIFAIDNNFTNNLQLYKQAMQNAGSTIKILVLRDGEPIILYLEIQHIMH